jgi:hypothetical protein
VKSRYTAIRQALAKAWKGERLTKEESLLLNGRPEHMFRRKLTYQLAKYVLDRGYLND